VLFKDVSNETKWRHFLGPPCILAALAVAFPPVTGNHLLMRSFSWHRGIANRSEKQSVRHFLVDRLLYWKSLFAIQW